MTLRELLALSELGVRWVLGLSLKLRYGPLPTIKQENQEPTQGSTADTSVHSILTEPLRQLYMLRTHRCTKEQISCFQGTYILVETNRS